MTDKNINITVKKTDQDTIIRGDQKQDSFLTAYVSKKNGRLHEEGFFYIDDMGRESPIGLSIYYGEDGQVKEKVRWERDRKKVLIVYENGQPEFVQVLTTVEKLTYGGNLPKTRFNTSYFSSDVRIREGKKIPSSYFSTRIASVSYGTTQETRIYAPDSVEGKKHIEKLNAMEDEHRKSTWGPILDRVCQEEQKQTTIAQQSQASRDDLSPNKPHS